MQLDGMIESDAMAHDKDIKYIAVHSGFIASPRANIIIWQAA